jgi:hypothetical protein
MSKAAKALRASLLVVITRVDELCDLVEGVPSAAFVGPLPVTECAGRPLCVERVSYSVLWGSHRCVLGCTMAFQIMERLAKQPNEYIHIDRLLDDLWTGHRTYSTVRSTVSRLKSKLRESGMDELAASIDGGMRGHYGLVLHDL